MIWFAGILQNTCCNKVNENKTKKNTELCMCGVFDIISRVYLHCVTCIRQSVFYCKHTNDSFFISGTSTPTMIIFHFFWTLPPIFCLSDHWEDIFLGAPLQDRTSFFLCPWSTFLGCVLEETHGTTNLEARRDF